ncbi:MAG: acetyl-CoA carboxylase carboxyltransferase subunit alpha [Lentisphaeria bacterium]|nr:acetyl-CoA carboxylase carboxyltransferase subunit alpha [Lentisphaeria bacterium]
MAKTTLEFEQPIFDLEQKLADLRAFSQHNDVDVSAGIHELEQKIAAEKKRVFGTLTPWQRVRVARHPERPLPTDYIDRIFDDFLEFKGDRRFADDQAIIGGFAKLNGRAVMLIASRKGRNLKDNVETNFGSAHPEGYRKALRLMQVADKANVPIICLIDTPGAYPGVGAEERHIAEAIAVNLREMFTLTVPIVCVVIGEGGSGGALGIGCGNRVLVMENAYYSVITPEGCAAILWRDASQAPKAAEVLKLTGADLMKFDIIDGIVPEPMGGAHRDWDAAAAALAETLETQLEDLQSMSPEELLTQRYERFRKIGVFEENQG